MPRKPRASKITEAAQAESTALATFEQEAATIQPMTAAEIVADVAAATAMPAEKQERDVFDQAIESRQQSALRREPVKERRPFTFVADVSNGIRVVREVDRRPGQIYPQVVIQFADHIRPSVEERGRLKAEGFTWQKDIEAWGIIGTAVNLMLAKQVVNDICKGRGAENAGLVV